MKGKNLVIPIIIGFLVLIGLVIGIIFATGILNVAISTPSGIYVQAPTFYYYECNAASEPVESTHVSLTSGSTNGWVKCPSNTDTCDLWISQTETTKWYSSNRRIVYQICHAGGSCDPQVFTQANSFILSQKKVPSVHIPNLLTNDKVWIDYQRSKLLGGWELQPNGAEWYNNYKPFILWKTDMFGGGRTEYTSIEQGCNFPSGDVPNLLNSMTNSLKQINSQSSTSNSNLPFYKTRNFIGTYVPISTSNVNFVTYNGKTGYCLNRQVFAITSAVTNGATYQIVDSNFNTRLANSVTCCPGENEPTRTCTSDFTWQDKDLPGSCSAFKACEGADWEPSGSKQLIRYNCVNSRCVSETKNVECTRNSDCGNNQICDTSNYKCINVEPGTVTCLANQTLINGKCVDISDNKECKWYQTKITSTSKDYGFLYYRFFTNNPKISTTESCKTSNFLYVIIILGVVLFFVLILILIILLTRRK